MRSASATTSPICPTSACRLADVLDPVGIDLVVGDVTAIDLSSRTVAVSTEHGAVRVPYDCLVLAAGSELRRARHSGVGEYTFDIDT